MHPSLEGDGSVAGLRNHLAHGQKEGNDRKEESRRLAGAPKKSATRIHDCLFDVHLKNCYPMLCPSCRCRGPAPPVPGCARHTSPERVRRSRRNSTLGRSTGWTKHRVTVFQMNIE